MHDGSTISDRVRDPGNGLVVAMSLAENLSANSQTTQTYKAWFFKVTKAMPFYYEYDQLGALNAGDALDYDYLGDAGHGSGSDILRIDDDDFHVYHFGYVPEHPDLRVYEKVSASSTPNRALDRTGSSTYPDPATPAQSGFTSAKMTEDKYDPLASTERVSFRNDDEGEFLQFGFRAESDIAANNANLHLSGRAYKLVPVTATDLQDSMVSLVTGDESQADSAAPPTVMATVGGLPTFRIGTELPAEWDDNHAQTLDYGVGRV